MRNLKTITTDEFLEKFRFFKRGFSERNSIDR